MQTEFPLTLTLSPSAGEGEKLSARCEMADRARHADRLKIILPLPIGWGEGQGEGFVPLKASGRS